MSKWTPMGVGLIGVLIGLMLSLLVPSVKAQDACDLDFTNDGVVDNRDIEAFVRVYSEGPCAILDDGSVDTLAPACDSIDFNGDGSFYDPEDITAFQRAFDGGPCPNGWYPVPKWADQVRVWLAPSYGNDANSGIKRELAVATPTRAYALVQDAAHAGRPWAVVIPRGEWIVGNLTGEYGAWAYGASGGRRGYIAADPDDDPSLPRPVIDAGGGSGFIGYCGNITIASLEFRGHGADASVGVHFYGRGSEGRGNIVVSDVLCREFSGNFAIQGSDKADPIKNVVVSRCASKWAFRVSGYAQGAFVSCADGVLFDTVTLQQNGYRWADPVDPPDVGSHNYYGVSNATNIVWNNCVTVEASATGLQFRGRHQVARGCVAINNPLGITAGHAQALPDEDSSAEIVGNLIIGGGDIDGNPRSFSIGVNRASGVVVRDNIIWRVAPEGLRMDTGAAFWLQGGEHQEWDISGNLIYDPRINLTDPPTSASTAPLFRDDRPIGSTPTSASLIEENTLVNAIPASAPTLSGYLDSHGVNVFAPEFAGRTFGELASLNRRGDWKDEWESKSLISWWKQRLSD